MIRYLTPTNGAPTTTWHTPPPSPIIYGGWFPVRATGHDSDWNLGGINVEYRVNGGDWTALANDPAGANGGNSNATTSNPNGITPGIPGTVYRFRCYAWDLSGANSGWTETGDYVVTNRNPSVSAQILNSSQGVIGLNGSGRAPVNLGDNFYIRVSGSDPDGRLAQLYSRLHDATGDQIDYVQVGASGSSGSHTFGPYAASELGVWDMWAHAQDADQTGYQWQGGGWWGTHTPDIEVVDTAAPTVPGSLLSSSVTGSSFTLSWLPSTDNDGITAYEIRRSGTSLGTVAGTSISVGGLSPATTYVMTVRARDSAGNWSAWSPGYNVTTSDTVAPGIPTGLGASSVGSTSFTLSWNAASDNVGVTGYEVLRDATSLGTQVGTSASLTGLTQGTDYSIKVRARDAAGNWSGWSSPLTVATVDSGPPSAPTGLAASSVNGSSFVLNWSASSDNIGVTGYEVRRDSASLGTQAGTTATLSGLADATTYSITVRARDAAGNWSGWSSALSVTTVDVSSPSIPGGLAASGISGSSFTLTWSVPADNVGVTLYEVRRDGVSLGTTSNTSMGLSGLAEYTTYSMAVRARDAAGNWSGWSSNLPVLTGDVSAPATPSGLAASNISGSGFTVIWASSADNVGTTAYEVRRGATSLGTTSGTSLLLSGLSEVTTYAMTVRARDGAGNWSGWSTALNVTTVDGSSPSIPVFGLPTNVSATELTISWSASDNVGVVGYEMQLASNTVEYLTANSKTFTNLAQGVAYTLKVRALDAASNLSGWATTIITTDDSPPTVPVPIASGISASGFTVLWSPSTDNHGVAGYEYQLNSGAVISLTNTQQAIGGLNPGSTHTVKVRALDNAGNESAWGQVTVSTKVTIVSPASWSLTVGDSQSFSVSTDGTATSYGVTAGSLPPGLNLNTSGVISGTPTQSGTYTFTLGATNSGGTQTQSFTLTVNGSSVLPEVVDFEAFSTGDLSNQGNWAVPQGAANVTAGAKLTGNLGLELSGGSSPGQATLGLTGLSGEDVVFVDIFLRPNVQIAEGSSAQVDLGIARIGFGRSAADAEVRAWAGDGSGGGNWLATGVLRPIDGSGGTYAWARLTVRLDFENKVWDLYVDSQPSIGDIGFVDDQQSSLSLLKLRGGAGGTSWVDDLYFNTANPVFVDADKDGLPDDWETEHGLNPGHYDRGVASDSDGDGLSNWEEFALGTHPGAVDSDGDGIPDLEELLSGSNPLVPTASSGGDSLLSVSNPASYPTFYIKDSDGDQYEVNAQSLRVIPSGI
ncbi:fibronectin type III domain-containing protein [Synoicihabitans lomoniglobus]|uniref:Fibronectin type III domain-containing protein n=1 Tax=Synoicihabitans lomoniglobus TaxID=2909285 RepID=A0AAF0CR65_9BACT|nr:fibronectin type III domain-containing protein [Opitutaceae bacterium LMO-M01]